MYQQIILHVHLIFYLIRDQVNDEMDNNFAFDHYKVEYRVVCIKVNDYQFKSTTVVTNYDPSQDDNYDQLDNQLIPDVGFNLVNLFDLEVILILID